MVNYKDLLILRLSSIVEWKNEREMIIPEEMHRGFSWYDTCEFLGDGKYILRDYYKNGSPRRKEEYQNEQQHGFDLGWWPSGRPYWKIEYQNRLRHGYTIYWDESGNKYIDEEYKNGRWIRSIK